MQALGWTLLHFVWQGAAVAALLASLNLILRRATAQARYVLACASLLAMLALPALTFRVMSAERASSFAPTSSTAVEAKAARAEAPVVMAPRLARVEEVLPALVTLWGAGVLLLGLRSFGGWTLVRRLGRAGLIAPPAALAATLARLARVLRGVRARPPYESALVGVPTVIGWLRPVILLPASALTGLTAQQLEVILAHELAHIRRHDYLVNLVQSAARRCCSTTRRCGGCPTGCVSSASTAATTSP